MASLFHRESTEEKKPPTPHDLIEKEISHLKKGTSTRHGGAHKTRNVPWLIVIGFLGLAWLYLMDPFYHAWYKGEAIRAYLYLHQYGSEADVKSLLSTNLLSAEEVDVLNHRNGSYLDYYKSADEARKRVNVMVKYETDLALLHKEKYETLDPVGRMRCVVFIRYGIVLPTDWAFLDPTVSS